MRRGERDPVHRPVDVERAAHEARTATAPDARARLERADEHRLRQTGRPGHKVQAVMHPIGEIDVGVPGISVHDLVARAAPAARRVRSKVVGP
jgi:hypothetical protein